MNMLSEDFNKIQNEDNENKEEYYYKTRFKYYAPYQSIFLNFNPMNMFNTASFERFIVDTINSINIDDFITHKGKDLGGPEEYNPRTLLAIIFYAYSNGIFSSRKIDELCKHDVRYMFISGYETQKYSTICRFIIKYQMQLKEVFKKILYIADDMGYINYNIIATDGTKIQANASKKFTGTIEGFKKISTKSDEKIKLAIEKHQSANVEIKREYWGNKKKRYEENKSKIDNFLNTAEAEYTIRKKERKQNITDNDCIICSCYSDCIDKLKYPQYKVFSIIAKVFDNWS